MIKLHAAYSKKVPAESEYSSKSFHASLEIEVADDLIRDGEKLQEKLRALWTDLQEAVETQIRESNGRGVRPEVPPPASGNGDASDDGTPRASQKQIGFLTLLAKRVRGWGMADLQRYVDSEFGDMGIYDLSKADASALIEDLQAMKPSDDGRPMRRRR